MAWLLKLLPTPPGRAPTKAEIADLADLLPLAMSAYSTPDELRKEVAALELQLVYHEATTEARVGPHVAVG